MSGKNPIGGAASGFQFGGASQFGAMGGSFGAANVAAPAVNDPYANIDIDLSKVKKAEKPSKPFEQRTEEEKVAAKTEINNKSGSESTKSNLKRAKEEAEAAKSKKEVRFGKSTTYQVENTNDSANDTDENFNSEGIKQSGSPRPSKKIIETKDLSDGRDEKEKIKEQMELEEKQALEALNKMEAWKKAHAEKEREEENTFFAKHRLEAARAKADYEDSVNSSAAKPKKEEESYSSDPFEEVSASNSGSKNDNIWTRNKNQLDKKKPAPAAAADKLVSSSSGNYDDDFESMSKSKTESLIDSQ